MAAQAVLVRRWPPRALADRLIGLPCHPQRHHDHAPRVRVHHGRGRVWDGAVNPSELIPEPDTAGRAAATLIGAAALFQVAVAAGAPWGAAAWGGAHPGVLPRRLRRASAVSALALGSLAVAVGTSDRLDPGMRRRVLLGATGYFALGTVMNAASRSRVERAIWTPVAGTTAALLWRAAPASAPRGWAASDLAASSSAVKAADPAARSSSKSL